MASPGYRPQTIRFGLFALDIENRELLRRGNSVKLQPQQFDILLMLVEHAGRIVSREEIRERIWDADTFVDFERSINFAINQIRAALKDDPENPRFIETVPKRGYRFIAAVETHDQTESTVPSDPIFIDRRQMESEDSVTEANPLSVTEPVAAIHPVTDSASTETVPKPRTVVSFITAGFVVAAFALVWWLQHRSADQGEVNFRQLTNNPNDNPITNASVSPDGKYLAYVDLGGLHVKLLLTGEVHDFPQPQELGKSHAQWLISWLPDSTRFLVCAFGLGISPSTWQASVVSNSLRLLRKDAVTWSVAPDGKQFAFTEQNERELWLKDIEGDRVRKVADAGEKNWFSYAEWSPDGSRLLYIKRAPTKDQLQSFVTVQDLRSASQVVLLSSNMLRSVNWLQDGRILYVEDNPETNGNACRNWIARVDKASAKFSVSLRQLTQANGFCIASASATADGTTLYFLKQAAEFSVYVADFSLDGTKIGPPRHITSTADREFPTAWTPDSREIIFVSRREGKWGFYRQALSSDTATPILTGIVTRGLGSVFPRLSPDGAWLVYAPYPIAPAPAAPMDILKVPISSGSPQLITRAAVFDIPRCSRAPSTLCAFAVKDKDQLIFTGFYVMRGAGQELARMKIDPGKDYGWDLSPDGTRIAILKRGTSEIHIVSLQGHEEQKFSVKGWGGLTALDWASDGKGLFTSSQSTGSVLLRTDLNGNASILWQPKGIGMTWADQSPDGRHVAMPGFTFSSNVWSMHDF